MEARVVMAVMASGARARARRRHLGDLGAINTEGKRLSVSVAAKWYAGPTTVGRHASPATVNTL